MKRSLVTMLFLVMFQTDGTAQEAQTPAERAEAMQAELTRVSREIQLVELYDRADRRADFEQEVARLEEERRRLLHIMPEEVDEETFIGDLRKLAARWDVRIQSSDPVVVDIDDHRTISTTMTVEGEPESIEFFSSQYSLASAVRTMRELESTNGQRVFEATAYIIPPG